MCRNSRGLLYRSFVFLRRTLLALLAANLGRPGRVRRYAKRPFASKIIRPLGLGPNGWNFVPSGRTLSTGDPRPGSNELLCRNPWPSPVTWQNSITPIKAVMTDKTPIISRIDLFMDCLPRRGTAHRSSSIPPGGADHRARKPVYTPLSCGGKLQPELPLVVLQGRAPCFRSDVRANGFRRQCFSSQRLRLMGSAREVCCPSCWASPMRIPSGPRM